MTRASSNPTGVLIAEDKRNLADIFAGWVDDDYEVRTAYDGEEAIELMDESIQAVVLDRRMPGLSGDEVLAELRDRGFNVPVAFISAVEPEDNVLDMDFSDYIIKPASRDEFQETIERLTALSESEPQVREYFQLKAKRDALEMGQGTWVVRSEERYDELESKLERLEDEFDIDVSLVGAHPA